MEQMWFSSRQEGNWITRILCISCSVFRNWRIWLKKSAHLCSRWFWSFVDNPRIAVWQHFPHCWGMISPWWITEHLKHQLWTENPHVYHKNLLNCQKKPQWTQFIEHLTDNEHNCLLQQEWSINRGSTHWVWQKDILQITLLLSWHFSCFVLV